MGCDARRPAVSMVAYCVLRIAYGVRRPKPAVILVTARSAVLRCLVREWLYDWVDGWGESRTPPHEKHESILRYLRMGVRGAGREGY